ncbi:COX20 family protein [Rufibacter hautae]|uniref:Uncharacterized protein n=1 Tax=Rufibacter hautae TaxID=2595005 RepID=A0A5B6TE07_9BACT|nr:hypothetical protein [Rufibacter hautae]KAA3437614.1 hypothetical protein FOA19_09890 [Rufibacter hautae]
MKAKFLSFAVALLVLLTITIVYANNPKWTKAPCVNGNTITGMATGLGTGPYELHITGLYDCVNKGGNTPRSANWSNLDIVVPVTSKQTGGNFKISAVIPSQCDHANWTFLTKDLQVTLIQNGTEVISATPAPSCN